MTSTTTDAGAPTISIVMAVRNGARTIERALESAFGQTCDRIEVIVIDAASTDGTQAILERHAGRIAYWVSEPDGGVFDAWNKALDHASGDWICFLGADDRYHAPDVMAAMARAIAEDDGRHRVVYGMLDVVRDDGSVVRSWGVPWDDEARRRFRKGVMIPHPATFHHRSLFDEFGRFDVRFRIAGDYEFLIRVLLDHDPLFVPVQVLDMAPGGLSNHPSSRYRKNWEVHQARYQHGLTPAPPWRSRRLLRRLVRIWIAQEVRPRIGRLRDRLAGRPTGAA